jgi:hypothetical protein
VSNQVFNEAVHGGVAGRDVINHTTVHTVFERAATWSDLPSDELQSHLVTERTEFWQAWRRFWFNAPMGLMVALLIGGGFYFFHLLMQLRTLNQSAMAGGINPLYGVILLALTLGGLAVWLDRIRRVEGVLVADAQANIDAIRQELRRRRHR